MRPARAMLYVVLIATGGLLDGDRGALVAVMVVLVLLFGRLLWDLPFPVRTRLVPVGELDRTSGFPSYTTVTSALSNSRASARTADLSLLPVLRRVLDAAIAEQGDQVVRRRLGEEWWALLDPARPISSDSRGGGLSAAALEDLVNRLEMRP